MVLVSTTIDSGRSPASIPSSPSRIARSASASATIVTTTSHCSASAFGVSATAAPIDDRGSQRSSVRFQTVSENPASDTLRAIGVPIRPETYEPDGQVSRLGHVVVFSRSFGLEPRYEVVPVAVEPVRVAVRAAPARTSRATSRGSRACCRRRGRSPRPSRTRRPGEACTARRRRRRRPRPRACSTTLRTGGRAGSAMPVSWYCTMNIVCRWASRRLSTSIFTAMPL